MKRGSEANSRIGSELLLKREKFPKWSHSCSFKWKLFLGKLDQAVVTFGLKKSNPSFLFKIHLCYLSDNAALTISLTPTNGRFHCCSSPTSITSMWSYSFTYPTWFSVFTWLSFLTVYKFLQSSAHAFLTLTCTQQNTEYSL